MPVIALYCKEQELRDAVTALRELGQAKIAEANSLKTAPNKNKRSALIQAALTNAEQYLKSADALEYTLQHGYESPTADEEKAELRKMLDNLASEAGYRCGGRLVEQLESMIRSLTGQKKEAFGLVGTIIEDQHVKLEAMRWLIHSALNAATHKSKDGRLRTALEASEEIVNNLQKIDPDNLDQYLSWQWKSGSWNVRHLNAELRHKESQLRQAQERIDQLEASLNKETDGGLDESYSVR